MRAAQRRIGHHRVMTDLGRATTPEQVAALDGAVAELLDGATVRGWVAVQAEPFRNLFLAKKLGCWLLFTWADGTIEIDEDYPPYALVPELLSGTFTDEHRGDLAVRWATAAQRDDLWHRYGIRESPGHYRGLAAKQHKRR